MAILRRHAPTALALTRQKIPIIDRSKYAAAENLLKGAFILAENSPSPKIILIGTGSELQFALGAYEQLAKENVPARVVSMPSWELFEQQSKEYRNAVLPPAVRKRVVVEAAVSMGWDRYLGEEGIFIGMKSFGASAPYELLYKEYGFTTENVLMKAKELLG